MCPACHDKLASILGRLGSLVWLRCRSCGMTYAQAIDDFSPEEIDTINDEIGGYEDE